MKKKLYEINFKKIKRKISKRKNIYIKNKKCQIKKMKKNKKSYRGGGGSALPRRPPRRRGSAQPREARGCRTPGEADLVATASVERAAAAARGSAATASGGGPPPLPCHAVPSSSPRGCHATLSRRGSVPGAANPALAAADPASRAAAAAAADPGPPEGGGGAAAEGDGGAGAALPAEIRVLRGATGAVKEKMKKGERERRGREE